MGLLPRWPDIVDIVWEDCATVGVMLLFEVMRSTWGRGVVCKIDQIFPLEYRFRIPRHCPEVH